MQMFLLLDSHPKHSRKTKWRNLGAMIALISSSLVVGALLFKLVAELCLLIVETGNTTLAVDIVQVLAFTLIIIFVGGAPWIASAVAPTDENVFLQLKRQRSLKSKARHHRQWWDLNVVVLFLVLLSLTYVRHFSNVSREFILWCVLYVFLGWIGLRRLGLAIQEIYDRRNMGRRSE